MGKITSWGTSAFNSITVLHPSHKAFSHEPSWVPQRGCSEYCCLKIDRHSRSRPLPSGELQIYVDHSQPANNLPASVRIQPSLSLPRCGSHIHYGVLSPVQSAKWRLLPLTPLGSLAFAAKLQCRPLTWWMLVDNKPSCQSAADITWPAGRQTMCPVNSSPPKAWGYSRAN